MVIYCWLLLLVVVVVVVVAAAIPSYILPKISNKLHSSMHIIHLGGILGTLETRGAIARVRCAPLVLGKRRQRNCGLAMTSLATWRYRNL